MCCSVQLHSTPGPCSKEAATIWFGIQLGNGMFSWAPAAWVCRQKCYGHTAVTGTVHCTSCSSVALSRPGRDDKNGTASTVEGDETLCESPLYMPYQCLGGPGIPSDRSSLRHQSLMKGQVSTWLMVVYSAKLRGSVLCSWLSFVLQDLEACGFSGAEWPVQEGYEARSYT